MKVYLINLADVRVFCDGKRLRINREGGKEYVETDKTDGQPVTLRFLRKHELSRPFWWLYALLFWVLGVMGFFTPRYSKFPHSLDCLAHFTENKQVSLQFRFAHYLDETGQRTVPSVTELTGNAQTENPRYIPNNAAKRRRKIYLFCSWLGRILLLTAIAAVTIKIIVER